MGFLSGSSFSPDTSDEVLIAQAKLAKQNISRLKKGTPAEQLAQLQHKEKIARLKAGAFGKLHTASKAVGFETGSAVGVGMRQQVDFSNEQHMLRQMFGHGEKIWGVNNEPVRINHDLNSGRSDPFDETAGMFGFGHNGERSGLF